MMKVSPYKYVGIWLDDKLTHFKPHIHLSIDKGTEGKTRFLVSETDLIGGNS